jgi:CheY-like chemotaxis protein/HPt (histidine-containing phosphotransfer) domain-containing protein
LLVIDENESVRTSIASIVAQWQWRADLVASAAEALLALQQANENNHHYDAILLDRKIDYRADQQSLSAIRNVAAKNTPVILMTNMYGQSDIADANSEKPDGVLFKPVTSSTLYDSLNELSSQVKNHGGGKHAVAMNNVGTTAANGAAESTNAHKMLKGVRALLVEDNEFNQIVARDLLEQAGALVDIVGDGEKAVAALRNCAHLYDIILMDVQMPVMDGFTATKKLRHELNITLPIIAMTAGVTEFERHSCIQSGMDDLIAKPIEVDKMIAVIARYTSAAQHAAEHTMVAHNNPVQEANTDGVFDISKLMQIGGDKPDYVQKTVGMVRNLVTNTEANFAVAKNAFAAGDYAAVAGVLHSLRGSLGILGARRLVENALVLEQLISEQAALPALETALQAVETELSNTLAAASQWLQSNVNND